MLSKINSSVAGLRGRLAKEESGFTLIELLVVLVIIGVLLAIAVPSYLGFKERAEKRAAQSNIRAAIPAAEAYYSDNGTYNVTLTVTDEAMAVERLGEPVAAVAGSPFNRKITTPEDLAWAEGVLAGLPARP